MSERLRTCGQQNWYGYVPMYNMLYSVHLVFVGMEMRGRDNRLIDNAYDYSDNHVPLGLFLED